MTMIYITLDSFRCHTETDEVGSDEPYVIVTAIDLRASVPVDIFKNKERRQNRRSRTLRVNHEAAIVQSSTALAQ
jgi:hypothetical protein